MPSEGNLEVVSTQSGKIKGKCTSLKDGTTVYTFRNIPYAKPPVGNLRFMPPKPADPWEGVRDGTIVGNIPMFPTFFDGMYDAIMPHMESDNNEKIHSEDCLHLTVYTPKPQKGAKLPVLIWLYGGGFQTGCERDYDASPLAGMNDIVVVIPNYRVGIFGFLSLGKNSCCSGNAGLMDQQEVMRWVHTHIEDFGGDNANITLSGESAGANAVQMHLVSPLSRGLFHKAVSQSGQVFMEEGFQTEDSRKKIVDSLLSKLSIEEKDDVKILETLQGVPAEGLAGLSAALMGEQLQFTPTIDGKVFEGSVVKSIKEKKFAKLPYIIGCNSTEGQGLLSLNAGPNFSQGLSEEQARKGVFFPLTDEGFELCKKEYLQDDEEVKFSKLLGDIISNGLFIAPAVNAAQIHSDAGADVYCFVAKFQLRMHHDPEFGKDVYKKAAWCECDHGDDVFMLLGAPFYPGKLTLGAKFSDEEKMISRNFMTYISNFAKTGNPNTGVKMNTEWPKYNEGSKHLVVTEPLSVEQNFGRKSAEFWFGVMQPHLTQKSSFIPTPK